MRLWLIPLLFCCFESVAAEFKSKQVFQDTFKDGSLAPKMLVIPAGEFLMGSPEDEFGRYADESPQHKVTFAKPFALGLTEVTVAQFRRFVEDTGFVTAAEKSNGSFLREPETGRWKLREDVNWRHDQAGRPAPDDNPVVHISWDDAKAYMQWLSRKTGASYRFPTEAEMEYAIRGGTRTVFWWGDTPPSSHKTVNIKGEADRPLWPDKLWKLAPQELAYVTKEGPTPLYFDGYGDGYAGIAPVASFKPNPFGLHDISGNVWEWTQDCWHASYYGAPTDGGAWTLEDGGNCEYRIVRGGSFYCVPRHMRSANRWTNWPIMRSMYVGMRLARDLPVH